MHVSDTLALVAFAASAQAIAFPQFGNFNFNSWIQQNRPKSAGNSGTAPSPASNRAGFQIPSSLPVPSSKNAGPGTPAPSTKPTSGGGCPAVWTQVSKDLTAIFLSGGQCTDDARAAIRAVFHDCFPDGGCDGSLALPAELSRPENTPMTSTINKLSAIAKQRGVGIADVIAFAGCKFPQHILPSQHLTSSSAHAVVTCPGGPLTRTMIGRKDATSPAPANQLPSPTVAGDDALSHFQAKGFSATDLAALIGAHTAAKQFVTDPSKAGAPEDTTPGVWDVLYYSETIAKTAPFTFVADTNLVNQAQVGPVMKRFAGDKLGWDAAFSPAMAKLELLGTNQGDMVDCTSALPQAHMRRDAKAAPVNGRSL